MKSAVIQMANFVKVGDLTERITFQKPETVKGDYGEAITTYVDLFSCWASVREQMLQDVQKTAGTTLENTITFIIRYQQKELIKTNMRIVWQGTQFEIVSFTRGVYKKDFQSIIAKEV